MLHTLPSSNLECNGEVEDKKKHDVCENCQWNLSFKSRKIVTNKTYVAHAHFLPIACVHRDIIQVGIVQIGMVHIVLIFTSD